MSAVWLFVYGSLRRDAGGGQHPLLAQARFAGPATVSGVLYQVDWYPGLVPQDGGTVHGELYELPVMHADRMLQSLDDYEGGGFRRRKLAARLHASHASHAVPGDVAPAGGDGSAPPSHDAWAYTYLGAVHALDRIASGDFGVAPEHRTRP